MKSNESRKLLRRNFEVFLKFSKFSIQQVGESLASKIRRVSTPGSHAHTEQTNNTNDVIQTDATILLKREECALDTERNENELNVRLMIVRILLKQEEFVESMAQSGRNERDVMLRGVAKLHRVEVSALVTVHGRNDENEEDDEEKVEPQKKRVKTESPSPARLDTPQIQLPEIADPADDSASLQVYAMI
eukprot:scaffold2434_cov151-Skeletonema_dohrnii-CCMP3373.AAC.1